MILFKYILKEFAIIFLIVLSSMITVFWIGDFFANMGTFLESHASMFTILKYFIFKTPVALYYIIPFAVLASGMYFFGKLNSNYELVAFRTLKIKKQTFYKIFVVIGMLFYFMLFINNEILIPKFFYMSKILKNVYLKKKKNFAMFQADKIWYKKGNYILKIDFANFDKGFMKGVTLFQFDKKFHLIERIDAYIGIFAEDKWTLKEVEISRFLKDMTVKRVFKDKYELPVKIDREDFFAISTESKYIGVVQDLKIIKSLKSASIDTVKYKTELFNKFLYPFTCMVFLFFSFILNLKNPREKGAVASVVYAVLFGFVFLFVHNFFINLAYAKILPYYVAPLLIFLISFVVFLILNKKIRY